MIASIDEDLWAALRPLQQRAKTKTSIDGSDHLETAREVELPRVRVSYDMQGRRST
jgi:hypothetical protein